MTTAMGVQIDPEGRYRSTSMELGRGAYKVVYKAFDTHLALEVAWNRLSLKRLKSSEVEKVSREVDLLKSLDHPSIISCHNSWESTDDSGSKVINFITELMMSGTLKDYLGHAKEIHLKVVRRWCLNILNGINYLHTRSPPIMHRDIKCDNIFINGHLGEVKIGDLGLSGARIEKAITVIGTPEFMAPELYDEDYTEKVDVYAFGMCVLEMITFEYPYSECQNPAQIFKKVSQGIPPASLAKVQDCALKDVITRCLAKEDERPSAQELLSDPVFQDWESDDGRQTTSDILLGSNTVADQPVTNGGGEEVAVPKKLSPVFRQAEGINREILITRTPAVELPAEATPLVPADIGEIRIGIHIPVDGCTKRIEFGYDPVQDSIDVLAEEMVTEFGLDPSYVDKVRAEIRGQVLAGKSSSQDPRKLTPEESESESEFRETILPGPKSSLPAQSSHGSAPHSSNPPTRNTSPQRPQKSHVGHVSSTVLRMNSTESDTPAVVVIGDVDTKSSSGRSDVHRQLSESQPSRPASNGSVISVPGEVPSKTSLKGKVPLNEKEFALNMSLMDYAAKGRLDKVKSKLAQGASAIYADYDRRTALHLAATEGHAYVAEALLEAGANLDARDRWGSTPVRDAKRNDHVEVLKLFGQHTSLTDMDDDDSSEGDITENIDGRRLLEFSARGDISMVREIVMAGVFIHHKDYDGRTALHLASSEGHLDVADLLLLNGGNPSQQDRYGRTPIDDARASGHRAVLELLEGTRRIVTTPPGSTVPSPPPTPSQPRSGVVTVSLASEAAFAESMSKGGHMAEIVENNV